MIKRALLLIVAVLVLFVSSQAVASDLFTPISELIANPAAFNGKHITVLGHYTGWKNAPGSPPVTRSDWVVCDEDKNGIYCSGKLPQDSETGETHPYWTSITVLGVARVAEGRPYIQVIETNEVKNDIEKMYSVSQMLFSVKELQGQPVGLLGVLAKDYTERGERVYMLADPTGAVKLGRLPKLYPKGTILHIKGRLNVDDDGLPVVEEVEIISAKVL